MLCPVYQWMLCTYCSFYLARWGHHSFTSSCWPWGYVTTVLWPNISTAHAWMGIFLPWAVGPWVWQSGGGYPLSQESSHFIHSAFHWVWFALGSRLVTQYCSEVTWGWPAARIGNHDSNLQHLGLCELRALQTIAVNSNLESFRSPHDLFSDLDVNLCLST